MTAADSELDWGFCKQALQRHSRTFAVPIAFLPHMLERTVSCAYLLCRIADTIEDTAEWSEPVRKELFHLFLGTLDGTTTPAEFSNAAAAAGGKPDEAELLAGIDRVYRVFEGTPPILRRTCSDWIGELTRGMAIYSRRRPGADGIRCLLSEADLSRYCYFVAGAIGNLLTDAFIDHIDGLNEEHGRALRTNAEAFGAGLQLVNILRDIRGDLDRNACFVPRTLLADGGLSPTELLLPDRQVAARRVLAPLFEEAQRHLDAAFDYALAIPSDQQGIRQFCLVPLWLAVATLRLCQDHPSLLTRGEKVRLSRGAVGELIRQCALLGADDQALSRAFQELKRANYPSAATG